MVPFEQPLWWMIEHGNQVNGMMEDIELMILGKMTKDQFLIS
jgi:hypothetical protein